MKVTSYKSQIFGKGTNPGGGVCIYIIPETQEELDLLEYEKHRAQVNGREIEVNRKLTRHKNNIPLDGGMNLSWVNIEQYIQRKTGTNVDLMTWAKAQYNGLEIEKVSDLMEISKIEIFGVDSPGVKYTLTKTVITSYPETIEVIVSTAPHFEKKYRVSYHLQGWRFLDIETKEELETCIQEFLEKRS